MLLPVVLQDEPLVELAHALVVDELGNPVRTVLRGEEHSLHNQLSHGENRSLALVAPREAERVPAYGRGFNVRRVGEKEHLPPEGHLATLTYRSVPDEERAGCLERPVEGVVLGVLVVLARDGTRRLLPSRLYSGLESGRAPRGQARGPAIYI